MRWTSRPEGCSFGSAASLIRNVALQLTCIRFQRALSFSVGISLRPHHLGATRHLAEQAGLEPTHRNPSVNGLAIRRSTCYAYCSVCTARHMHEEVACLCYLHAGLCFVCNPPSLCAHLLKARSKPPYSAPVCDSEAYADGGESGISPRND